MAGYKPSPLSAMSPAQITNAIAGYTAGLPKPLTDAQIQTRAQGLIDPVVSSITDRVGASTKAGMGAITGYANSLANSLGGYGDSAKQIYGGAEQAQAAADAAESGAVRTGGSQLANELAGKIGQITSDPSAVASATPDYNGAANAVLGTGSAALSALIGRGTAAQDYAAKLPGLARAQGASDLRDLGLSSQKNIADQVAQVEQKLPDLVQALRGQSDTRASNIASTRNDAAKFFQSRNDAINAGKAKNATTLTAATTKANAAVTTAKIKAQTAAETAKAKASETSFKDRLAFAKTYGYDPITNATLPGYTRTANGTVTKAAKAGSGTKGALSDAATIKLVRQFHDGTTQSATVPQYKIVNGKPDTTQPILDHNGAPVYKTLKGAGGQMDYGQAYAMLRSVGHKTDAEARAALNTVYQRGEQGRSWVTNDEQAALRAAGVQAKASVINGHGVLSAKQVAALHKAGVPLPPGSLSAEGAYVIAKGY